MALLEPSGLVAFFSSVCRKDKGPLWSALFLIEDVLTLCCLISWLQLIALPNHQAIFTILLIRIGITTAFVYCLFNLSSIRNISYLEMIMMIEFVKKIG